MMRRSRKMRNRRMRKSGMMMIRSRKRKRTMNCAGRTMKVVTSLYVDDYSMEGVVSGWRQRRGESNRPPAP
jgi:hypothetical protein